MRNTIISVAVISIIVSYLHSMTGGLIIGHHSDGTKWYSNELMSSGSDDSFIMQFAFFSFVVTLLASFFKKILPFIYYINLGFFYFLMFSVNLDVPILDSIMYGDFVLLVGILAVSVPAAYNLTTALSRSLRSQGRS